MFGSEIMNIPQKIDKLQKDVNRIQRDITRLLQHFHGVGCDQTSPPLYYPDNPKRQILISLVDSDRIIKRQCLTVPSEKATEMYESIKKISHAEMTDGNIKL